MSAVYDTGALIAADRNDRRAWADHRARLEAGVIPVTTAPVVAQASRSPRQAQLHRFLQGCDVVSFRSSEAQVVGALLAKTGSADVVDAHVVVTAARLAAMVITGDPEDLRALADHVEPAVTVRTGSD